MICRDNLAVTLSMPVYKSEKYVEKSLLSVLGQDFDNMEILIIDNASPDNSMSIVEHLINRYEGNKLIRVIHKEINIGLGEARNMAIKNAKGKYLFFMDSDDEITPDCISKMYKAMQEYPVDFVAASYDKVNEWTVFTPGYHYEDRIIHTNHDLMSFFFQKKGISVTVWNKLYDVSFLRKKNIFCIPTHINEDAVFSIKLFMQADSCRLIPDLTLHYSIYNNSFNQANKENWTLQHAVQVCEITQQYFHLLSMEKETYKRTVFMVWMVKYIAYLMTKIQRSGSILPEDKKRLLDNMSRIPVKRKDIRTILFKNFDIIFFLSLLVMVLPYKIRKKLLVYSYKIRHI